MAPRGCRALKMATTPSLSMHRKFDTGTATRFVGTVTASSSL
jgi:hypothetical protein